MGVYDMFGEHHEQLKVGPCILHHYTVGDRVYLPDGVYCGYERAIVINGNLFVADLPLTAIFDKWGSQIAINMGERNPLRNVIKNEVDRLEKEGEGENFVKRDDQNAGQSPKTA